MVTAASKSSALTGNRGITKPAARSPTSKSSSKGVTKRTNMPTRDPLDLPIVERLRLQGVDCRKQESLEIIKREKRIRCCVIKNERLTLCYLILKEGNRFLVEGHEHEGSMSAADMMARFGAQGKAQGTNIYIVPMEYKEAQIPGLTKYHLLDLETFFDKHGDALDAITDSIPGASSRSKAPWQKIACKPRRKAASKTATTVSKPAESLSGVETRASAERRAAAEAEATSQAVEVEAAAEVVEAPTQAAGAEAATQVEEAPAQAAEAATAVVEVAAPAAAPVTEIVVKAAQQELSESSRVMPILNGDQIAALGKYGLPFYLIGHERQAAHRERMHFAQSMAQMMQGMS